MDFRITSMIATIFLLQWLQYAHGIIGYDCSSSAANITTVSLLEVGECNNIEPKYINTTRQYVQLLQLNDFESVEVYQCKVEIHRKIIKCWGMLSFNYEVKNGDMGWVEQVSRENCMQMHKTRQATVLNNYKVTDLLLNSTKTIQGEMLVGSFSPEGSCKGSHYNDMFGSWDNVVVRATIKVALHSYFATVNLNTNKIKLAYGDECELLDGKCIDSFAGNTFWNIVPDSCQTSRYAVLFEGLADKTLDLSDSDNPIIYSLNSKDTLFSLAKRNEVKLCGYTVLQTEHPKLYIYETTAGDRKIFSNVKTTASMNIFTYINSKFVYVENHIRENMKELYRDILLKQCELEQKVLKNALTTATLSPDIFAYNLMKGPGYTSLIAGEVIHIIKCLPVEVKFANVDICYSEMPVMRGDSIQYLTPQTHILLKQGTEITCSSIAPMMFLVEKNWYKMTPKMDPAVPPIILKPMTKETWKYTSPEALATSGIYTSKDLDDLSEYIVSSVERPATLNTIARGVMGYSATINREGSIMNLMDKNALEKLVASAWERLWGRFTKFGTFSASIFGIIMIIRLVKLVLDTIIQGFALHSVYGCSVFLVGAVWNSLAHLLIQLSKQQKVKEHRDKSCLAGNVTELQEVTAEIHYATPITTTKTNYPQRYTPFYETSNIQRT